MKDKDWDALANKLRQKSMAKTVSQGKDANTFKQLHAIKTFDDGHRDALEELLPEMGLTVTIIACVTDSDTRYHLCNFQTGVTSIDNPMLHANPLHQYHLDIA